MDNKANTTPTAVMVAIITVLVLIVIGLSVSDSVREAVIGDYTKADTTTNYPTDFSADRTLNFTLTNCVLDTVGSLQVDHDNQSNISNISIGGVSIGALANSVGRQTFTVPISVLNTGTLRVTFTVASPENITDVNLTYNQYSGCDSYYELCESGEDTYKMANAGFTIIPVLVLILAASGVIGMVLLLGKQ